MRSFWNMTEDEQDQQLNSWVDELRDMLIFAKKNSTVNMYQTKATLMEALGCSTNQYRLIMRRAQVRGIPIVFKNFQGYYIADEDEALRVHIEHPTRVTTGTLDGLRSTTIALGQAFDKSTVLGWFKSAGVDPSAFCQTLELWNSLNALPAEFTQLLLGSGDRAIDA